MKNIWYVANMNYGNEVSVNYGNPKKHQNSYGWADMNKIIIGKELYEDSDEDNDEIYVNTEKIRKKKFEIAEIICKALNENKIKV